MNLNHSLVFTPVKWHFDASLSHDPQVAGHIPISIELCRQYDGSTQYAVRQGGCCMDATGYWLYEPLPSSRDESFLKQFRFLTWEDAAEAILTHCADGTRQSATSELS